MKKITLSLLGFLLISLSASADNLIAVYEDAAVDYSDVRGFPLQSIAYDQEVTFNDFKMTPNPSHSKFELKLPSGLNNVKLDIFDVLGKKVLTKALSKLSSTIDVSKWNDGVYLVKVTSDSGTHIKRFIKQ
ncbi:T9SS type A sorting domain-containing protein [uncultured Gelidibacter sp.]|uniref:T9SS type A sorting domain-containing protein n=1 Tax=uncultured Gelidibacter sp. TaxID=259318 RepID=UPI00261488C2|nr:T9SS type A sorting domain-containing protein [uncultured Gelidibacter sp.]